MTIAPTNPEAQAADPVWPEGPEVLPVELVEAMIVEARDCTLSNIKEAYRTPIVRTAAATAARITFSRFAGLNGIHKVGKDIDAYVQPQSETVSDTDVEGMIITVRCLTLETIPEAYITPFVRDAAAMSARIALGGLGFEGRIESETLIPAAVKQ